jgi:hypothetical protein
MYFSCGYRSAGQHSCTGRKGRSEEGEGEGEKEGGEEKQQKKKKKGRIALPREGWTPTEGATHTGKEEKGRGTTEQQNLTQRENTGEEEQT